VREQILADLEKRLGQLISVAEREKMRKEVKETEKTKLLLSVDEKKSLSTVLLQVAEFFKTLGGEQEQELLNKLEMFVSYGLSTVFGASYQFVTQLGVEGKDLKVDFFIRTNDLQSDVAGAKGGGVAEVVSILLQLFFVIAMRGVLCPFLLLDTAMVHLSEKYHANMSTLLKELAEKLKIQVVLLAHSGEYGESADRLYRFTQRDGKTIAEVVK
jgi:hypothetical protein